jgi:hypothetical protein
MLLTGTPPVGRDACPLNVGGPSCAVGRIFSTPTTEWLLESEVCRWRLMFWGAMLLTGTPPVGRGACPLYAGGLGDGVEYGADVRIRGLPRVADILGMCGF